MKDKVKLAVLAGRFNTTKDQAQTLMQEIHADVASILGIPETAVSNDAEFLGRNLDLTFTINKQNAPKGK